MNQQEHPAVGTNENAVYPVLQDIFRFFLKKSNYITVMLAQLTDMPDNFPCAGNLRRASKSGSSK